MKQLHFSLLLMIIIASVGCTKNNPSDSGNNNPGSTKRKPNSVLDNYEFNGSIWQRKGYMLLDLNHADNRDKRYMVVDIEQASNAAGIRFILKQGPLPIDSLATNWPTEVKFAAFGYSNDVIVNANMRLYAETPTRPYRYRYDSLYKFPSAILTYNYLHNPRYAGSMAGKDPQGRITSYDGAGPYSAPRNIMMYLKEGFYTNVLDPTGVARPFTEFINGTTVVGNASMSRIDAVTTVPGAFYKNIFFDFDAWEFFVIEDFCPSTPGANCTTGVKRCDYQSMDVLMTWPDGWGK